VINALLALALLSSTATRNTTTPAGGVTRVTIIARGGSLTVNGHGGMSDIKATGHIEAPSDELLAKTKLVATRSGSEVTIETQVPEETVLLSSTTMDLEVNLPAGVAVVIRDGSGSIKTNGTGALDVTDGSGSIDIDGVTGNVRITDGSGSIEVEKVTGNVVVTDDGSGAVNVSDVRGDFTVMRKGSGHIEYERISGKVSVPQKH
jgi:DUF4097 and DUF4098 domain-containing protein YvlB